MFTQPLLEIKQGQIKVNTDFLFLTESYSRDESSILTIETESLLNFQIGGTQQIATVVFNGNNQGVVVTESGKVSHVKNVDVYNPSSRRGSTCVYVRAESEDIFFKMCILQHKGSTIQEWFNVSREELETLGVKTYKAEELK